MAILCALGLHRPGKDEVWNQGWYFTQCERCGADLVRTGSSRWRVPEGRKVVWKSRRVRGRKPGDSDPT